VSNFNNASIYSSRPHILSRAIICINRIDMLLVRLEFSRRRVLFKSNSRIFRSISYIHSFRSFPWYATSSLLQFSSSQLNAVQPFNFKNLPPTNKRDWKSASRCRCDGFLLCPLTSYHNCCRQHCVFSPFLCTFTDLFHKIFIFFVRVSALLINNFVVLWAFLKYKF